MKSKQITITISDKSYKNLEILMQKFEYTRSHLIREALKDYLHNCRGELIG
jgi:metal-responsive CopG/Arc/MetJ family transcriptional regulator